MKTLYEDAISYGGHPNQGAVASSLLIDHSRPDAPAVKVGVLHAGTLIALAALKASTGVAVGAAKTAGLIYPERFRIAGVDDEINRLVRHSAEAFGRRAEAERAR